MGSLSRFDKFFGGERGAADKTLQAYKKTYGSRDGQTIFDARIAKLKRRASRAPRRRK